MGGQGRINQVPYEFPTKPSDRDTWERLVTDAIRQSETLSWRHVVDAQWVLAGTCPRCQHQPVSQYYDFGAIVAGDLEHVTYDVAERTRSVDADEKNESISVNEIEFVCSCESEPPHKKDVAGCGWGKTLKITVPGPN